MAAMDSLLCLGLFSSPREASRIPHQSQIRTLPTRFSSQGGYFLRPRAEASGLGSRRYEGIWLVRSRFTGFADRQKNSNLGGLSAPLHALNLPKSLLCVVAKGYFFAPSIAMTMLQALNVSIFVQA